MNKLILLLFGCFFSISIVAQETDTTELSFVKYPLIGDYEEIVESNLTKDEMWINLKKWVATEFTTYKFVVDLEDKEAGVMIIKWGSTQNSSVFPHFYITSKASYQIDVKDNKYRIKISNPRVIVDPADYTPPSQKLIKQRMADLRFVLSIHYKMDINKEGWSMDNKYYDLISNYLKELNNTPKYANIRKKTISQDWQNMRQNIKFLIDVEQKYVSVTDLLINGLKKQIIFKDMF